MLNSGCRLLPERSGSGSASGARCVVHCRSLMRPAGWPRTPSRRSCRASCRADQRRGCKLCLRSATKRSALRGNILPSRGVAREADLRGFFNTILSGALIITRKHPKVIKLRIGAERAAKEIVPLTSDRKEGMNRPSTTCAFHKNLLSQAALAIRKATGATPGELETPRLTQSDNSIRRVQFRIAIAARRRLR